MIKDRRKWKDEEDNDEDDDDDGGGDDEGVVTGAWKLGYRKRSQFEGLMTKKKKSKMEHPLQKYRKGGRVRGNRGGKGKEKPLFDDDFRQDSGRRKEPTTTAISTTTTTQDIPGTVGHRISLHIHV